MDKYGNMDDLTAFGFLANTLGGGGDRGQSFPRSDAEDMSRGARFIPGEVTLARRRGERVIFVQNCKNPCCWYWEFLDGKLTGRRAHYWSRPWYERVALENGISPDGESALGNNTYSEGVGACPLCGNEHMSGGLTDKEEA